MIESTPYPGPSGSADRRRGHPTTPEAGKATPGKSYAAGARQPTPTDYHGRPVLVLNSHWAVGADGALQWFLLRRAGLDWRPRRFHVERGGLLCSIRELCGSVDPVAVEAMSSWPAIYLPTRWAVRHG
jgi:hypothetical protein